MQSLELSQSLLRTKIVSTIVLHLSVYISQDLAHQDSDQKIKFITNFLVLFPVCHEGPLGCLCSLPLSFLFLCHPLHFFWSEAAMHSFSRHAHRASFHQIYCFLCVLGTRKRKVCWCFGMTTRIQTTHTRTTRVIDSNHSSSMYLPVHLLFRTNENNRLKLPP